MSTGLMPADKLSAFYDPERLQLTLGAEGSVQPVTEHIHFARQPFAGGLLYELLGTTYAVMGEKKKYSVEQKDHVSIIPFPKDVIIKTAEHPKGIPVIINWGGTGIVANAAAPSSTDEQAPVNAIEAPNEMPIIAMVGRPFTIKQSTSLPPLSSIRIDFDSTRLDLTNAGWYDNTIVWTFVPTKVGATQVTVYKTASLTPYVVRIPYNVDVILLEGSK